MSIIFSKFVAKTKKIWYNETNNMHRRSAMKTSTSKILALLLCVSTLLTTLVVMASCGDKKGEDPKEELTYIIENGDTKYNIVRADRASDKVVDMIVDLRLAINGKFGCDISIESDWVKPGEEPDPDAYEILVGDTNRPETQEVKQTLEGNTWAVHNKGNKLVICATDEAMLAVALDWFIENYVNASDKQLGVPKNMAKTEGFTDELPISVKGISSYQIAYTKGNADLQYYASLIQRHTSFSFSKMDVVADDKINGENVISVAVDNTLAANEYKVTVDKSMVNVRGGDEDSLYYALNYFLEYGLSVSDTIVTLKKDYSLSGKLENYFSNRWDMPVPALDHSSIAPAYDIGAGLENDKNADTITDSYLHLASNIADDKVTQYTQKLESFGFKSVYSADTDGNTLTCYRLGKAYVYLHHCPRQKALRVIWDKSSTCEVSDVEYTAQGNGTTTFYQYSLDYTNAELNFTGKGINCGMLYIIKLSDNSLILVDSGHNKQSSDKSLQGLCDFLYEITKTDKKDSLNIRFWYYTHPDGDHNELTMKLFNYMKDHGYKIPNVEALGFAYPSERANDNLSKTDGSYQMLELMKSNYPDINYLKLHTGMVFNIGEVKFEVISTVENFVGTNGKIPNKYGTNDVCSVVRFSFDGMSVLMQGDQGAGTEKENYLINLYSPDFIKSDVIQIAHHGFNNTSNMFALCKAEYALLSNSRANLNGSVKESLKKRGGVAEENILDAGDYTYGLKMTDGQIEVIKIMRYDNPNKK